MVLHWFVTQKRPFPIEGGPLSRMGKWLLPGGQDSADTQELDGPLVDLADLSGAEIVGRCDQGVLHRTSNLNLKGLRRHRQDLPAGLASFVEGDGLPPVHDLLAAACGPSKGSFELVVGQVSNGLAALHAFPRVPADAGRLCGPRYGQVEFSAALCDALRQSAQVRCGHAHMMTGLLRTGQDWP
jgi:hypothetical protein